MRPDWRTVITDDWFLSQSKLGLDTDYDIYCPLRHKSMFQTIRRLCLWTAPTPQTSTVALLHTVYSGHNPQLQCPLVPQCLICSKLVPNETLSVRTWCCKWETHGPIWVRTFEDRSNASDLPPSAELLPHQTASVSWMNLNGKLQHLTVKAVRVKGFLYIYSYVRVNRAQRGKWSSAKETEMTRRRGFSLDFCLFLCFSYALCCFCSLLELTMVVKPSQSSHLI